MSLQISTSSIDAGYVSGRTEYEISLTNTGAEAVTISTITTPSFRSGLAIAGAQAPVIVGAGASVSYTLIVRRSGDADFSGSWVFSTATQALKVTATGHRAILWPFAHNWASDFQVKYEWKTDVFTAPSGREKRVAQRHQPRRTASVTSLARKERFPEARALLSGGLATPLIVPDPTKSSVTTGAGLASSLPVSENIDWLLAGSWVVVGGVEFARVTSYSGTSVVFERDLSKAWPTGTPIQPAYRGEWATSTKAQALTDSALPITIELREYAGDAVPAAPGVAESLFDGKEVFPLRHNWTDNLQTDVEWRLETIDPGFGRWVSEATQLYGRTLSKVSLMLKGQAAIDRYVSFFNRMRGQQGAFYKVTGLSDLMLVEGAEKHSARWIRVRGNEAFQYLQDFETTRAIEVTHPGGVDRRSITSFALDGESTLIQLDEDPQSNPATWSRISWLQLCRFASDTLNLTYKTDSLAVTTAAFITIEDE